MKIYRTTTRGYFNEYEDIDGMEYVFSMSNMGSVYHGENFRFWLDDAGEERNVGHNRIRYKCDEGNKESECIFAIPEDGSPIFLDTDHTDDKCIQNFHQEKATLEFMEEFRELLLMHWYRKINSQQFMTIVKLVRMKHVSMQDAMNYVLYQEVYDDIYSLMKDISDSDDFMKNQITKACYYTPIEYVNADKNIVDAARRFIGSVEESYFNTSELCRYRNALNANIKKIDDLT